MSQKSPFREGYWEGLGDSSSSQMVLAGTDQNFVLEAAATVSLGLTDLSTDSVSLSLRSVCLFLPGTYESLLFK